MREKNESFFIILCYDKIVKEISFATHDLC